MATINVTKEQFPDIVIAFLLDKMIKGDKLIAENENFNDIIDLMERRGLKSQFLHYYMSSDPIVRSKYKIFSKSMKTGKSESGQIYIKSGKNIEKKEKPSGIKGLIKKALKLINAHKKRSGFPLSEEKIDKILDKLLKEGDFNG